MTKENNLPPRENNLSPMENNILSDGKLQMKLVKYSDNEMLGDYLWFFVNKNDEMISYYFESEEDAMRYLNSIKERIKNETKL